MPPSVVDIDGPYLMHNASVLVKRLRECVSAHLPGWKGATDNPVETLWGFRGLHPLLPTAEVVGGGSNESHSARP